MEASKKTELLARAVSLHQEGKLGDAEVLYRSILSAEPKHADALNLLGTACLQRGDKEEGVRLLGLSLEINPRQPGAYNNRGIALREMQRYDESLDSFDRAIALQPRHADAYMNRGNTLKEMQRYDEALASFDRAIALNPTDAEAHSNRGVVLKAMKRFEEALAEYDKALALNATRPELYHNRGTALQALKRYEEALASYDMALARHPGFAEAYKERGVTLQDLGRPDEAKKSLHQAIALKPGLPEAYREMGNLLLDQGNMQDAEASFRQALALEPNDPRAFFSLTHMRRNKNPDDEVAQAIRTLLDAPGPAQKDREYLYFALGKIYDDCGQYDKAFACYQQANQIAGAGVVYNPNGATQRTTSMIKVFTKQFLSQTFPFSSTSQSPVFVVGMPRSGTTLIASILSSHPVISSAGELTAIVDLTARLPTMLGVGVPYPQAAAHLTPPVAATLISTYEQRLRRDVGPDVPFVVDKYPLNFEHLGLIAMLFPKARIIHCTRNACDVALSNYFQNFSPEYHYSFDLRNTGHFIREYQRLMEHWRNALPMTILDVPYEEAVANLEPTVRKMLAYIGVEWDARCLTPHTNRQEIRTASNWQVRQPVYKKSVERWRHYEKHLGPLKHALGMTE